jgi:hypothetical protein
MDTPMRVSNTTMTTVISIIVRPALLWTALDDIRGSVKCFNIGYYIISLAFIENKKI